ncbi:MAG TPA: response regulator [Terriglobales bacterium]|jgi:CheY-like chemotaxis protein|nr:response regulator [Terriglobales bacterium]
MKRRILLVDDDVAVLLTLKAVLELNRFTVETATSAAEAIEKLSSGIYHMVITDARMENENAGFEVVRAARRQSYNPATALLTAYPPQDGDWKADGAQSLLVKPVGTQDLLRQVEALLILREDVLREDGLPEKGRQKNIQQDDEKLPPQPTLTLGRRRAGLNREGRRTAG